MRTIFCVLEIDINFSTKLPERISSSRFQLTVFEKKNSICFFGFVPCMKNLMERNGCKVKKHYKFRDGETLRSSNQHSGLLKSMSSSRFSTATCQPDPRILFFETKNENLMDRFCQKKGCLQIFLDQHSTFLSKVQALNFPGRSPWDFSRKISVSKKFSGVLLSF